MHNEPSMIPGLIMIAVWIYLMTVLPTQLTIKEAEKKGLSYEGAMRTGIFLGRLGFFIYCMRGYTPQKMKELMK